jgi:HlyD family secretion protein
MRIKAKINETKVNLVHIGQRAQILVDAYPDRTLRGIVTEINPISSMDGVISDVRIYYANIDIQDGFAELRPGLSVEVMLLSESRDQATRIPIDSVRWIKDQSYVAVHNPDSINTKKPSWSWRKVQLGLFDTQHAEVIKGVKLGDKIVAHPDALPAPILDQEFSPTGTLASASLEPSS